MAHKPGHPLQVDHRSYVKALEGPEHHQAWKQFTDTFWSSPPLGASERAEFLFRRGFLRDKWVLYGFRNADPERYLSDLQTARINQANDIYAPVLEDRMLLIHALSGYCRVPRIHALRGLNADQVGLSAEWQAHAACRPGAPPLEILIQPLLARARGRSETITLRDGQFEGFGKRGDLVRLSHIVRDWSRAAALPYLFTEILPQGAFLTGLYPPGRSHLCVLLTRDLDDWSPRLVAASAMIGSDRAPGRVRVAPPPEAGEPEGTPPGTGAGLRLMDGALSAPVDLERGTLGAAAQIDTDGRRVVFHDRHPDSGARIAGAEVPGWAGFRDTLLQIMNESSYIRMAFLEFTLSEDGGPALLGPAAPDLSALQVHRPLLDDPVLAETLRKLAL